MPNLFLNTMQNKLFKNKRESRCFRHSKNKIYLLSNIEDRHLLTENENKTKSLTSILIVLENDGWSRTCDISLTLSFPLNVRYLGTLHSMQVSCIELC